MRTSRSRYVLSFFALMLLAITALGAEAPRGIEAGDLDRQVEPCNDFFGYANGSWRAANPIPGSMPRWSRRWAAGEANKDRLKVILDAAAGAKAAKGSIEQLTGDFYGSCMDEVRIDRLGVRPIKPLLTEIAALKDGADVQFQMQRLHAIGIGVPFAVSGGS